MLNQALRDTLGIVTDDTGSLELFSPIDGQPLARLRPTDNAAVPAAIDKAHQAYLDWRRVPAPQRGELVRLFAEELRAHKAALAELVTLECGKSISEGEGEVQEMIDICDFAVGMSRQLHGLTIASERPDHHLLERWHPIGVVGVISAFNFPVAVWCWNAALAWVCGNAVVWKPSEQTPLCALACLTLFERAAARFDPTPQGLAQVLIGAGDLGRALVEHPQVALISATGSTTMGRDVALRAATHLKRTLLELGGNAAMIVAPSADLELATRAITFAAVGTAGQRCTSLRRLLIHSSLYDDLLSRLEKILGTLSIGDPRDRSMLVGPLINEHAFNAMQAALARARTDGGTVFGGTRVETEFPRAFYVEPALVRMPRQTEVVCEETFAPILYALKYDDFEAAMALHNAVPQGLASCIFTTDVRESERFLSATGSDCGIANVNIGSSGAEIGGAFGGEKDTGGGRESGSDAWKGYMRRQTQTINYSNDLPLAQGVRFDI